MEENKSPKSLSNLAGIKENFKNIVNSLTDEVFPT